MTKLFAVGGQKNLFVEQDGEDAKTPLRLLLKTPNGDVRSHDLSNFEIIRLCQHLQFVAFEREKKVIWPVNPVIVRHYERAMEEAEARIAVKQEPTLHYYYHPESDSLFTSDKSREELSLMDPLVEEVDKATFERVKAEQAKLEWDSL